MSIISVVPEPGQAEAIVSWARLLSGKDEALEFLCLELDQSGHVEQAVREALGEPGPDAPTVTAIHQPMVVRAIVERVRKTRPGLLVTGPFVLPKVEGRVQSSDELVRASPCRTLHLLCGERAPSGVRKILLNVTGEAHDRSALQLVEEVRSRTGARVTLVAVEPETGAKRGRIGERAIQRLLHDAALEDEHFEIKVVTDRLRHRGILQCFDGHDLVVSGVDAAAHVRPLLQSLGDAGVAMVKRAPPLRLRSVVEWLPRINPADHADLLYNLYQGSRWGPDFILMLGLAAAIASLGLLQDSPAVVIGSMLLAPLMTPLMGLGVALGQASRELHTVCAKAVGLGFLLVLAVSFLIGGVTPTGETLTQEVLSRGSPNVLDLLIAVFAALAAAYAMARPSLLGSIAGVAIATALVPPACAIGISLAHGDALNALGAALLLLTNLVAIIVASNVMFGAMGLTSKRAVRRDRRLATIEKLALLGLLLVLAGPLSAGLVTQIEEGKNVPAAYPVTRAVSRSLHERVSQDEGVEIMLLRRPRSGDTVLVHLASERELPPAYAAELRQIVRDEMGDPDLSVVVTAVRGWWHSDSNNR